jgi:hypothetical protein
MASDPPVSSRAVQPHSGPQPAPQPGPGEAASPPTKASLKQWWRNFSKTPNKGSESLGISPPVLPTCFGRYPLHMSQNAASISCFPTMSKLVEDMEEVRAIVKRRELALRDPCVERQKHIFTLESIIEGQTLEYVVSEWPYNGYCALSDPSNDFKSLLSLEKAHQDAPPRNRSKVIAAWHWIISCIQRRQYIRKMLNLPLVQQPQGIFGVPLRQSIVYANVAISLVDSNGKSYIYGYVPIVVAKCGVFLKEKGTCCC